MSSVLPERINTRRKNLGFTQEDLAEMTGSSQNQIWMYESGKRMPSLEKLIQLAEVLQTSTDWLLGLSDDIMPIQSVKELSDAELRLLNLYRSKSTDQQENLLKYAEMF